MLFRGQPGHGLEPVRKMRRTVLDRPLLHGGRDCICHVQFQMRSILYRLMHRLVDILRKAVLHYFVTEYQAAVYFRHGCVLFHSHFLLQDDSGVLIPGILVKSFIVNGLISSGYNKNGALKRRIPSKRRCLPTHVYQILPLLSNT